MASVIANYSEDANFWEENQQFKVLGEFAKFYKGDRTKGKSYSSRVMWAVAFFTDIDTDNKFRNYPEGERQDLIADEFMDDARFDWNKVQYLVDEYTRTQLTQQKRSLVMLKRKLEEREEFLAGIEYTIENAKELDTIIANTDKLFSLMAKLEEQIQKEQEKEGGQVKGGRKESAGELKVI